MYENNWKYIMPAVHTSRIKDKIEEADGETFQRYTTRGRKHQHSTSFSEKAKTVN